MTRLPTAWMPVREIGTSRRSLTGRKECRGRSVAFESSLERDLLTILDFDTNINVVTEQPLRIEYQDAEGTTREYTPDFLANYYGSPDWLFEVKYREDLRRDCASLKPKIRAARRWSSEHGVRFAVITEKEIRGPFLQNARFLLGYRTRAYDEAIEENLARTLAILGESCPRDLLLAAFRSEANRMRAIAPMWRMLATRRIHTDLFQPVTMSSPLWVQIGEGFLWRNPRSLRCNRARSSAIAAVLTG